MVLIEAVFGHLCSYSVALILNHCLQLLTHIHDYPRNRYKKSANELADGYLDTKSFLLSALKERGAERGAEALLKSFVAKITLSLGSFGGET